MRSKDSMVSYSMPPWLFLLDEHTSPLWKPCSQVSTTILSCNTPHPALQLVTFNGGQSSSNPQTSQGPYLGQYPSWTSMLSLMPAPALGLASQSETNGMPGIYYQVGNQTGRTSDGLKLLASNSLPSPSYHLATVVLISTFMGTTKGSSKGGGKDAVETSR